MITKRKYKIYRKIAFVLVVSMLVQITAPTVSWALTSGPSQPEVQSFEPVGTTEMVDLFSGDFTYNIPLFELPGPNGGYPFNLHYNSGITMDQEASWTGLGWNLNPGAINRQMRGLPDEFDGSDKIKKKMDLKPNVTFGVGASADLEIFGGALKEILGAEAGITIYYNNYKGVGYTIGGGLSATISKTASPGKSESGLGVGLDLSLDSQEGVGANVNASLSNADEADKNSNEVKIGIGYNSRVGLTSLSLSMNMVRTKEIKKGTGTTAKTKDAKFKMGGTSSLSFQSGGYTPNVGMPMQGRNISLQFKVGGSLEGVLVNGALNGFFNTQYLQNRNKEVQVPAYGYYNLHKKGGNEDVLLDFNREKDGMVHKNSPNLAVPITMPDIYSVTGQGIGGMYRVFRNDVGVFHDQKTESNTAGGALGIEVGAGVGPVLGADLSVNYSSSKSGKWTTDNSADDNADFKGGSTDDTYEPAYFKTYGEPTSNAASQLDFMGGEEPVRIELNNIGSSVYEATSNLTKKSGGTLAIVNPTITEREPRNVVIQYVNNNPKNGLYAVNPDGTTYFYNQIASNESQVECIFAAGPQGAGFNGCGPVINITSANGEAKHDYNNTNQFYSRTVTPAYPHAYMLSAIVGPDYIDADAIPGPSQDDLGYWVKFNYNEKYYTSPTTTTALNGNGIDYNWRAPFYGANFLGGLGTTFEDDKGSYMYGSKKVYYLTSAETKTHSAEFVISQRDDARGASTELQNGQGLSAYSYKLDKIILRSKADPAKPIKIVNFEYTYELCQGNPNHTANASNGIGSINTTVGGKLTLKRLFFTYEKSNRGSLSPYEFSYFYDEANKKANENPSYDTHKNDRWGFFQPNANCSNIENPYVKQFDENNPGGTAFRDDANLRMSAWHLKAIQLPTGGTIKISYEADDYAYVQNKRAMQMFKIASLSPGNTIDDHVNHPKWANDDHRKVYFKLKEPIVDNLNQQAAIDQYFAGVSKLYFKVFMWVRTDSDNRQDYVSGYSDILSYGLDATSKDANNSFTRGYVTLSRPVSATPYHPFSAAAWNYIRTDNPALSGVGPYDTDPNTNKSAAMDKVKSLVSVIPEIIRIFSGFFAYAKGNNWGEKLDLDKSFIRLNSPDQRKIGGGVRVKQVTLTDNWDQSTSEAATNAEPSATYGQVYDYTINEGGREISSGVAQNEPQIGVDESPLRSAKEYTESVPLKTNNNFFFEMPANESYYPGPSVGYRKVTVKSLATYYEKLVGANDPYGIPDEILTTGASVHEFYTAKEFPVIVDETEIQLETKKLWIPIPLVGQISEGHLYASQGYSIVLNDMHGKPRRISNFKQDKLGNVVWGAPISWVEYTYSATQKNVDSDPSHDYYVLKNTFPVITSDINGVASRSIKSIGEDYEFFTDMRESETEAESGGLKANADVLIFGPVVIPLPPFWPSFSYTKTRVRTAVTNKIIHRSGMLVKTQAFDEGSVITTQNELYDAQTGQAILTSVTNDFGDPIYNYSYPAYFAYAGMGPAYKNIGFNFTATFASLTNGLYPVTVSAAAFAQLVAGDEFIMGGNAANKAVIVKKDQSQLWVKVVAGTANSTCTITRSGRRNQLTGMAGNIKTLGDKSKMDIRKAVETQAQTDAAIGDPTDNWNR